MVTRPTSDEACLRVMLADLLLEDRRDYYNSTASDPLVAAALGEHDRGDFVMNLSRFEVADGMDGESAVVFGGRLHHRFLPGGDSTVNEMRQSNGARVRSIGKLDNASIPSDEHLSSRPMTRKAKGKENQ